MTSIFLKIISFWLVFLSAVLSSATEPPYSFNEIDLGSGPVKINRDRRFKCKAVDSPLADRNCGLRAAFRGKETIAGVPILSAALSYSDDRLTTIVITFAEARFDAVKDALQTEYGPPENHTVETYVNRMYELVEGRVYVWNEGDFSIDAVEHFSDAGRSAAVYKSSAYMDDISR